MFEPPTDTESVALVRSSVDERNESDATPPGRGYCGFTETVNDDSPEVRLPSDCAEAAKGSARIRAMRRYGRIPLV